MTVVPGGPERYQIAPATCPESVQPSRDAVAPFDLFGVVDVS